MARLPSDNDPRFTPPLETGLEDPKHGKLGQPRADAGGARAVASRDGDDYDGEHGQEFDMDWLQYARDAWRTSETWFDSSQRVVFERALSNFRGVHPPGSKYHSDSYLKKSRIFRPKTRAAIRRGEAGHAIAFFSTHDVVHCSPLNSSDEMQVLGAEVHNSLLNMRMNDPKLRWFQTLLGGCQDAMTVGVVISKQYWRYESRHQDYQETYEEDFIDEFGHPDTRTVIEQGQETTVVADHPEVMLFPVENFRFDPACDWRDPVNSSPYLIELQPTYVWQVKERIRTGRYRKIRTDMLSAAIQQDWDSVRKQREGQRVDKYDNDTFINDYRIVWVHHNTMRIGNQDYVYDTLGVEFLLEDPKPIETLYAHSTTGDRPYAMGVSIIETHKSYPIGIPQLIEDLQEEANDVANLRLDNVKHAINKRWFVRRGRGVDIRALVRNVPGSVTLMSDPGSDVQEVGTRDVTQSSYEEQDRLNMDIDDIVGTFSGSSVGSNQSLNKTVGGMNLLSGDASMLQEYMIRTVSETWVEPVMRQLVKMEAIYESDENILRVASSKVKQNMEMVLEAMKQPVNVNVNVGFNATNPQKRVEKLSLGLATVANFAPDLMQGADRAEIVKEVFGSLGYQDGIRFFPQLDQQEGQVDPQLQAAQQQIQELMQIIEGKQVEGQTRIQGIQMTNESRERIEQMKAEIEIMKFQAGGDFDAWVKQMENRLQEFDRMIAAEKADVQRRELWLQREALSHTINQANREYALKSRAQDQSEREGASELIGATDGPHDLPGNDKAGVIGRENYDLIPQNVL